MAEYSPKQVVVYYGGIRVEGFMEGTFVVADENQERFTLHVGADGKATRVQSNDESGRVTITLSSSLQSSTAATVSAKFSSTTIARAPLSAN